MPHSHIADQPITLFKLSLIYNKMCVVYVTELWRADPNFI